MNFFDTLDSRWIGLGDSDSAPYFFTKFECDNPQGAKVAICGLGYYELFVNGKYCKTIFYE